MLKIPNQVIPESKKTKEHLEKTVIAIVGNCKSSSADKNKDYESWHLYNERFNEKEFDYLRKVGQYSLPAKFRWIGVQRPRINLLESQESKRPFVYSIVVGDNDSKAQKYYDKLNIYVKKALDNIKIKKVKVNQQVIELQQKMQQLEQMLQQEPQNEQEMAMQQELQMKLPQIRLVVQEQMQSLNEDLIISEDERKQLDTYFRLSYKDKKEWYAQKLLQKLLLKLDLLTKKVEGFRSKTVTGKEYFYVDYIEGNILPTFEVLEDVKVYFPKIGNVDWVQDGPYVALEENYSNDQILGLWGKHLSKEDIERLEDDDYYDVDYSNQGPTKKDATLNSSGSYAGTETSSYKLKCWRVFFKSPRKIYIKMSPNPYKEGEYYRKFIEEEDATKIKDKKGEKLEIRYVTDIYEGVYVELLDKVIFCQKKKFCRTYLDDYKRKDLPVYGPTFSRISKQPYSLIRATEELQKLINILHYHKELLLAVAGTKVTVVDKSQIPSGMSPEEHQYHKKTGTLYIQTVTKGGRKINNSFNQWQTLDETVSPAIQYLDNMIRTTDDMIGYIMGIGPQRMGQVVAGDQVGKTEMAIQQNALVTEILYYEHDKIFGKALEALLNLACKYTMREGGIISNFDKVNGEELLEIEANLWANTDLDLNLENNTEEENNVMQLKQLAVQKYMQGAMSFNNVISLYRLNTLKELEVKFSMFEEASQEIAQKNQQQAKQDAIEVERAKIEFTKQYDMEIAKQKTQLEGMSLQLEQAKLEFEKQKSGLELEMKDKEIRSKVMVEVYKTDSEREVEMNYLEEQNRQANMDTKLRDIALQVDTMFRKMELQLAATKQSYDAVLGSEKIKVDEKKITTKSKEKIKD